MRNPLHNDEDLESFLHKRVTDHRMYPSDQLWRNIQKELHGEGRWPALTYISIFIITALSVCTLMVKPEERLHKNSIVYPAVKEETAAAAEKILGNNRSIIAAAPVQYGYAERMTQQTMQTVNEVLIARVEVETEKAPQPINLTHESLLMVANNMTEVQVTATVPSVTKVNAMAKQTEPVQTNVVINTTEEDKVSASAHTLQFAAARPASRYFSTIGLMKLSDLKKPGEQASSLLYNNDEIWRKFPLTNASDLWRKKLSKFSFQFYITPSVSYRRLTDAHGKTALSYTAIPRANNYQLDINHVVEHQAQMGAEVGFAMGYKLTNTLTAKGGLQFNLRQYGIKAYTLTVPQNPAEAVTDNVPNTTASNPDEVAVENNAYLTSANNTDVSKPVVLSNRYYELSVPFGLDWRILSTGNGRLTVNAAASLQPTYTFDKEPFVITTDYKNYTEGASIMRNWNLNSSMEAYVSYQMGTFRWQLGPQFRYQHFSTYSNSYPIHEHLLDYGLKIGFTKSLD